MNRDYFKDENMDNFDEEYEDTKCHMYKLKIMEELSLDGSDETFIGSDEN
jgi:hypothetical protein